MKNNGTTWDEFEVIVIGAGIAGCTIAGELFRNGFQVGLIEEGSTIAQGTSSHARALAHPQIGKKLNKLMRFTKIANEIAHSKWYSSQLFRGAFEPRTDLQELRQKEIKELCDAMQYSTEAIRLLSREEAEQKVNVRSAGIWYETAAVYSLPKICQTEIQGMLDHQLLLNTKVTHIDFENDRWHIYSENSSRIASAKMIILAGGIKTQKFLKEASIELTLRPVRGQLTQFHIQQDSPLVAKLPKKVIRGDGYCLPAKQSNDQHWVWELGSSYDEDQDDLNPWQESNLNNAIKGLNLIGCEHSLINELIPHASFVGIRSASKDRLPLIGPIHGHKGLLIACAYGSRGVLWSALGASLMRAYVEAFLAGEDRLRAGFLAGASFALEEEIAASVSPSRFLATRASNSKPIFPVS